MKARFALALLLGLFGSLGSAGDAQAQYGVNGYGLWGAYDVGRLYQVMADNVPYYAAFPPVYYSVPVPRTYGYSPFAYPPGVMTPEIVEQAKPVEIINPHVPASSIEAKEPADRLTQQNTPHQPLVITNPYVSERLAVIATP